MMKKRILMMFLAMTVMATSIPVPVMAEPVITVTEIAVSENSVLSPDVTESEVAEEEEADVSETENAMEEYEKEYNSMNGYIPNPEAMAERIKSNSAVSAEKVTAERKSSVTYPAKYDPRPEDKVSAVREQIGGTCWLFASVAAIESNLIHQGLADSSIDLSELQIAYFLYHPYEDPLGYYSDNTGKEKMAPSLAEIPYGIIWRAEMRMQ